MPIVSVLMPVYNAAPTLIEALESLTSQTMADFEVILVDDGSTDDSRFILQAWSKRDARFRLISIDHRGLVPALNAGLAACNSTLVARMDADDRSCSRRLEMQAAYLIEHPDKAVIGSKVAGFPPDQVRQGFRIYIAWLNSLISETDIRREMFVESPLAHPSVTFRREWVERVGRYQDHGWPEDYDLWLRLYLSGAGIAKLPLTLLEWREHPRRLTRTDKRYSLENFLRLKAHYLKLGPLVNRDAIFIWGAGMMGKRLGKQLQRLEVPLVAYADIDPHKIGSTRRGLPVLAPEELPRRMAAFRNPVVLSAVGARGSRPIIRQRLNNMGLVEAQDWWLVA